MSDTPIGKTGWKCDACLNCGVVLHELDAGVYDMVQKITDAHASEAPSECQFHLAKVRVWRIPSAAPPPSAAAPEPMESP
jgi:predicted dithiol-disulfide oxidoreductase (DUF899 family)